MATAGFCNQCSEWNKSLSATKYCFDCEERLCADCAETHDLFKSLTSHNVIDLSSVGSNNLTFAMKHCNFHSDKVLDCYCIDHQIVCCKNCIRHNHRKCQNVLPLEHASKDVKSSALFFDIVQNMKHMIKTLTDLIDNRESNLQRLAKTKSFIRKQIRKVKSRLLKQIDNLEIDLQAKLSNLKRNHAIEIKKQKEDILQVLDSLKATSNEINFLKDHGSTTQLFIALHQQEPIIHSTDEKVLQMVSNSKEIDITFDEKKEIKIESFEPLSDTFNPCQVQYTSRKFQQAQSMAEPTQIMVEQTKRITEFQIDTELKLKFRVNYNITDLSITNDDKLLLANCSPSVSKLYVYRDCTNYETEINFYCNLFGVAVIPDMDRAVVTLPSKMSIQFINTKQMTKGNIVNVKFECCGITAGRDKIYVGGTDGTIKTLDTNGTILKSIKNGSGIIYFILHDDIREQFIIRCHNKLLCVNFDGTQVYSSDASGVAGVTRDRRNNFYFGNYHTNTIQRLSTDWIDCATLLNEEDDINHPYGMCFNNDFSKLFVVNNFLKSVFVYTIK